MHIVTFKISKSDWTKPYYWLVQNISLIIIDYLAQIETKTLKFYPTQNFDIIKDNPDNRLLELAVAAKANFIITGNTNDFTMIHFEGTKIVSPKDYWDFYRV